MNHSSQNFVGTESYRTVSCIFWRVVRSLPCTGALFFDPLGFPKFEEGAKRRGQKNLFWGKRQRKVSSHPIWDFSDFFSRTWKTNKLRIVKYAIDTLRLGWVWISVSISSMSTALQCFKWGCWRTFTFSLSLFPTYKLSHFLTFTLNIRPSDLGFDRRTSFH